MKIFKKAKRGFTLVELVVVIAVIAILAAVSVGAYFGITDSANKSKLESEARGILTNIQLIANGNDSNCYMDREGIHIKEGGLEAFETKLNGMSGIDYEVINQAPTSVSKQTVYFIDTKEVSGAAASFETYYRYAYYTPDVGGKCAVYTFETNELKVTDANFDVTQPDSPTPDAPAPESNVNSVNIEIDGTNKDTHEFYIGQTANISITTDPENLDYTYSFSVPGIVDYSGGALVEALAAGTTIFTVTSKDDNTKTDSVTFTVKENAVTGIIRTDDNVCNTNYFEGDEFDPTGLQLALTYEVGEPVAVDMSKVTYDKTTLSVGDHVACKYEGYDEPYILNLNVEAIELDRIECNVTSVDTEYFDGDTFNTEGLEFTAIYNDERANHAISLNDLTKDLDLETGDTSVTFTYGTESVVITFPPVKAKELVSLTAVHEDEKPEYNIGDTVTIDGWTVTATFNNGDIETFTEMVEGLEIYPKEALTVESTHINFSYKFGEQEAKFTPNLPIHMINKKTFYFEDRAWWHKDDAVPYIQLSQYESVSLGKIEKTESDIIAEKVEGSEVASLSKSHGSNNNEEVSFTGSSVWKFTFDVNKYKKFKIYRIEPSENYDNPNYWGTNTSSISVSSLGDNNLISLENREIWCQETSETGTPGYTVSKYDEKKPIHNKVYLMGINGNWDLDNGLTSENEMVFDYQDNLYKISNVELSLRTKLKIRAPGYDYKALDGYLNQRWIGFDNKTSLEVEAGENSTKIKNAITEDSDHNFYINYDAIGKYTITMDLDKNIKFIFEDEVAPIEYDTNFYLRGIINGSDKWASNEYMFKTVDDENFYLTINLKQLDKIKFYDSDNEAWYGFDKVENSDNYFNRENLKNNNIAIVETGDYSFKFNVSTKKLTVTTNITFKSLYLKPNSNWTQQNARFAVWFFDDNYWFDMTDSDKDGVYKVLCPSGRTKVIFCRMNGSSDMNKWDNRWNQSGDLTIPTEENLFTVPSGAWDGSTTTWSKKS